MGGFCVAAFVGGEPEVGENFWLWTAIVLAFGAAAILATPLVVARVLTYQVHRYYRRATEGGTDCQFTFDLEFFEVKFGGSTHRIPWDKISRVLETEEGIFVDDAGFAKNQLDDDTIKKIRSICSRIPCRDVHVASGATAPEPPR